MIDFLAQNLGVSLEIIILILTVIGDWIFIAVDVRLGIMMLFVMFGIEFMAFTGFGLDTTLVVYAFFGTFALLATTMLITHGKNDKVIV